MSCRHGMIREHCGHCSQQTPMPSRYGDPGIRKWTARYDGRCEACGDDYQAGTIIIRDIDDVAWIHAECLDRETGDEEWWEQ